MNAATKLDKRGSTAFNAAAPEYDRDEASLEGFRASREITHTIFLRWLHPGDTILELNCGTGTDAIRLAHHGLTILATDISARMLKEAERKILASGIRDRVELRQLAFEELGTLAGRSFDGVLSNFGGLNCAHNLLPIASALGALVKPGGYFIATVMPDFCLWETISMLARLRFRGAFRRLSREGTSANVKGVLFPTWYYSPRTFARAFAHHFTPVDIVGVNVLTPPPGHASANRYLRPVFPILNVLDRAVASLPLFRRIGDHYVIVLRRNS